MAPTGPRKIEQIQAEFTAYLKIHDLRLSQSRLIILNRVLQKQRHFSAEDLAAELAIDKDRVCRGTVYRTLQLLESFGIIAKVHGPTRHHFEVVAERGHHDHLVCRRCGRMVEFSERKLTRPARAIAQTAGFSGARIHIQIHGLCADCVES